MAEQAIYDQLTERHGLGLTRLPAGTPAEGRVPRRSSISASTATRYSQFGRDATAAEATVQVDIYGRRWAGFAHSTPSLSPAAAALQRQHSGDAIDMMLEGERDDYEEDTQAVSQVLRRAGLVQGDIDESTTAGRLWRICPSGIGGVAFDSCAAWHVLAR